MESKVGENKMTYAGLTTADKGALLDAKARGANWVARDRSGRLYVYVNKPYKGMFLTDEWVMGRTNLVYGADDPSLQFIKWSDAEPVNIDIALAQIEEMERRKEREAVSDENYRIVSADEIEAKLRMAIIEQIPTARLRELADAEKDGRLVVLPVAEGGTAATPDGDAILNSWDIVARVTFCNEKRSHVYWKDKYADFDISDIKSKE